MLSIHTTAYKPFISIFNVGPIFKFKRAEIPQKMISIFTGGMNIYTLCPQYLLNFHEILCNCLRGVVLQAINYCMFIQYRAKIP